MPDAIDFIHRLAFCELPPAVVEQAKRATLDLVGVAAAGSRTELSRIVRDFAAGNLGGTGARNRILFDGRRVGRSGAAFAGASTIDAFDAHDGHRLTKGHAGVALLPALLALAEGREELDGRAFLTALVLGYEIATRAGIALHASVSDYHTSGAWNALGVAAIAARLLKLDRERTRHALGAAEYHGPRSQMMRCIDHPAMVKDGSGWGALAGMSAAELAAAGFTGAPAILLEAEEQGPLWSDLGSRWAMMEQYFKPQPVCRWAQPAVEAVAALARKHGIAPGAIERVEIRSFAAAVRLGTVHPATTEEAQYALGFPVAAQLVRGRIGADEIGGAGLRDPAIAEVLKRIALLEDETFTARFPAERLATATIHLTDGRAFGSGVHTARGDPETPLCDNEIRAKFRSLTEALPTGRVGRIEQGVADLDSARRPVDGLLDAVLSPVDAP